MRKRIGCLAWQIGMALGMQAQLAEHFNDGNFTVDPAWQGNLTEWSVNPQQHLQSISTTPNTAFYLSTPSTAAMATQWTCWVRLAFPTSSANYVDIYLIASVPDLLSATLTGYFVRIGNTQDEISLYRRDPAGIVKLIDGADGITAQGDNQFFLQVVRDANGRFVLLRDDTGTGAALQIEGAASDLTYTSSRFFGLLVRQSTTGFFGKHYFDDLLVQPYIPDGAPPSLAGLEPRSATRLALRFSEAVDPVTAQQPGRYQIDGGIGYPVAASRSITDSRLVELLLPSPLVADRTYTLTLQGIQDLWGHASGSISQSFRYTVGRRHDVLITEIMADPSPPVGLPPAEYVELTNLSNKPLQLEGWRLYTSTAASAAFPAYILQPDSLVILTGSSGATQLSALAPTLSITGFPTLANESSLLVVQSKEGAVIHTLAYSSRWYNNRLKEAGGWSLEMIDTRHPCLEASNWRAADHPSGGTPGRPNSVSASLPDSLTPSLLRTYTVDSLHLVALFSKPLDSAAAAFRSNYSLSPAIAIQQATPLPPYNSVLLQLDRPMQPRTVYELTAGNLPDCSGNRLTTGKAKAGRPEPAGLLSLAINEILFDPVPGQSDYVELYNRSAGVIDASTLFITHKTAAGSPGTPLRITDRRLLLFPGDYLLLCEDTASLYRQYLLKHPEATLETSALPSLPDDQGSVVILNQAGEVVDETGYSKDWHFALLHNREGVALERLKPEGPSGSPSNWHSAAASAGWGTPGYRNSQGRGDSGRITTVWIEPPVFSPNQDGLDDFALISYALDIPGFAGNIFIFDALGRQVRHLVKNSPLGRKGSFKWDGLDEGGRPLPRGIYLIASQFFDLTGRKVEVKNTVVLAVVPR